MTKSYAIELDKDEETWLKVWLRAKSDAELRCKLEQIILDLIITQCKSPTEVREEQGLMGMCQEPGCLEDAKYGIFKTNRDGEKKWFYVCDKHDKEIAKNNIQRSKEVKNGAN